MDMDRIKRKIAKLMNLAAGTSNEHEADNAMRKAGSLMNKFHVDSTDGWDKKIVIAEKAFGTRKIAKAHEKKLFWSICESVGVYGLHTSSQKAYTYWDGFAYVNADGVPCKFKLVGHPSDIDIAWYMFEVCLSQVQKQTTIYGQGKKLKRSQLNDYAMGLVFGLSARFKSMKSKCNEVGTGLVPVDTRKDDAEAFYAVEGGKVKSSSMTIRNNDFLHSGVNDAKDIRVNAGVETTKPNKTLRLG